MFEVILTSQAQADIAHLDAPIQTRVLDKLEWMAKNAA